MAITNLTGTSWQFGSELISDYATTFLYNIAWNYVIDYDNTTETGTNDVFPLASRDSNYYFPYLMASEHGSSSNKGLTSKTHLYYGYRSAPKVKSSDYPNFVSFTVTFTGGADATNANLIAWLEANATLVEEEPTATVITYNGSTIATLEAGQTATIKTAETEVDHDIVITPVFPIEIAYGDIIATAEAGQTATVKTANTEVDFDIVVSAKAEEDDNIVGTWTFNDEVSFNGLNPQTTYRVKFDYSGPNGPFIYMQTDGNSDGTKLYLRFGTASSSQAVYYWEHPDPNSSGWRRDGWDISYQTITITEQPTDETIIKWIKANATKQ